MKVNFAYSPMGVILLIGLAFSSPALATVSITISGLAQSTTGPFTAGDPISMTLTVTSGTVDSWSGGSPPNTPSQWSNDYPDNSIVISSVSSPSILNGPILANSTTTPFANQQIWDEADDRFTIGASFAALVADLGNPWYLTGINFETTGLPLSYVGDYVDPASWLAGAAGTYTTGLGNSFFFLSVSNGFQTGLSVSVDEVTIVPEPSIFVLVSGLAVLGLIALRRKVS